MNAAVILVISILLLLAGYVFYGGWLAKECMNSKTEWTTSPLKHPF